jgi:hypothetical protein
MTEYCCAAFEYEAELDPVSKMDGFYRNEENKWTVNFEGVRIITIRYCPFCGKKL